MNDPITRPAHYARFKIEPMTFILENDLSFLQGSVLKYLVRYPYKNGMEDLRKCRQMLDYLIEYEEKRQARSEQKAGQANQVRDLPTGGAIR